MSETQGIHIRNQAPPHEANRSKLAFSLLSVHRDMFLCLLHKALSYLILSWLKAFPCHNVIMQCLALQWRHGERDGVSNHQPHDSLLKRLFRRTSKKTSKLRATGLCVGNSPWPVNSPHKEPVTRKMFPCHAVIMQCLMFDHFACSYFSHVDRISAIDYVPSNQDILRTRQKTSGVLETNFEFNDYKYRYE